MKLIAICLLLLSGCTLTNNGQLDLDLIINVDVADEITKVSIGIGLPLALEKMAPQDVTQHASTVRSSISAILAVLENDTQQLDTNAVNSLLSSLDDKLSAYERHAIQSAMGLVSLLIKSEPHEYISKEVRQVLITFIYEIRDIYEIYAKAGDSAPLLSVKPLRFKR